MSRRPSQRSIGRPREGLFRDAHSIPSLSIAILPVPYRLLCCSIAISFDSRKRESFEFVLFFFFEVVLAFCSFGFTGEDHRVFEGCVPCPDRPELSQVAASSGPKRSRLSTKRVAMGGSLFFSAPGMLHLETRHADQMASFVLTGMGLLWSCNF